VGPGSPEWRHIPCAVRSHATKQNNRPKHQLRPHPHLPMFEPQPLWKHVRAGHSDDIESQEFSHPPQNRVVLSPPRNTTYGEP
jgi:hypothetical protein